MKTPPTPSPATRAALVALLRADPGITTTHRNRILAAFDGGEGRGRTRPHGWEPASAVAAALGIPLTTLLRWLDAGKVEGRRIGERLTLVHREEVAAYAADHPARQSKPQE